jgi:hypothetical protein
MLGNIISFTFELAAYPNQSILPQPKSTYREYDYKKAAEDSVIWSQSVLEKGAGNPPGPENQKSADEKGDPPDAHDLAAQWLAALSAAQMVRDYGAHLAPLSVDVFATECRIGAARAIAR